MFCYEEHVRILNGSRTNKVCVCNKIWLTVYLRVSNSHEEKSILGNIVLCSSKLFYHILCPETLFLGGCFQTLLCRATVLCFFLLKTCPIGSFSLRESVCIYNLDFDGHMYFAISFSGKAYVWVTLWAIWVYWRLGAEVGRHSGTGWTSSQSYWERRKGCFGLVQFS